MGPASWHKEVMKDMINAGVNVFRVNFSHGDYETHRRTIRLVKELVSSKSKWWILTLQAVILRTGRFQENW